MKKLIMFFMGICLFLTACGTNVEENNVNDAANRVRITPLASTIDMNNLNNCIVAISMNKGDAFVDDSGAMQMKVTVHDYDLYDMVDMAQLKVGDTIVIGKKEVVISSIERNDIGTVIINGGLENGGYELGTDESGVFYEVGFSDAKSYYPLGEATIRVSTEFEYHDKSNLDSEEKCYYPGDFLSDDAGIDYNFDPHNTSIVIEDGKVIEMNRVYVP